MSRDDIQNSQALIWSIAELLRGDFKQSEYQKVILPFTVLRRLDAVLEDRKADFVAKAEALGDVEGAETALPIYAKDAFGVAYYNTSPLTFRRLLDDADNVAANLHAYIASFSPDVREVMARFNVDPVIAKLNSTRLLYKVVGKFADVDLHPDTLDNTEMGYLYEELIRRFSELSNETAGEHFTPREVIRLMVDLLIDEDDEIIIRPRRIATVYDPACGTGGMLSVARDYIQGLNPSAEVPLRGQELNDETYAVCRSDMLVKGDDEARIVAGNSFTDDGFAGERFDYMLANPPFGVDWGKYGAPINQEAEARGFDGRFGAGLPRKSDGSMLFLQHMISKMKDPADGGSRIAIVFNASPLFTGAAGGGESEIRRWIIENDWLEAIVALPEQLFYNTGIATYVWIVSNRKQPKTSWHPGREGFVQLIDAREKWEPMKKSLGEKRRYLAEEHITEVVDLLRSYRDSDEPLSKVVPNHHFGLMKITVERPKRRRFEVTESTLTAVRSMKQVEKLDDPDGFLDTLRETGLETTDQAEARLIVGPVAKRFGLSPAVARKVADALGVRDDEAPAIVEKDGNPQPDPELRDTELVPLPDVPVTWEADVSDRLARAEYRAAIKEYMESEVLPWVPDAWVDHSRTKIGYEIPFTREFYVYEPPRPLAEIRAEIEALEAEITELLGVE